MNIPKPFHNDIESMEPGTEVAISDASSRKKSTTLRFPDHDLEAAAIKKREAEAREKYGRGRPIRKQGVKDRKLKDNLRAFENRYKDATLKAKDAEILLENESGFLEPEGELERTYKVRQDELKKEVSVETAKAGFDLKLEDFGPYMVDYTRNRRGLLLAGRKGHVSAMDWRAGTLGCELHLGETVRDAKWLHNDQ